VERSALEKKGAKGKMVAGESNDTETTITFVVRQDNNAQSTPRWRKVAVENAICPNCGQVMAVVVGDNMYGYCPRCQSYYVAD
jgi:formamidopyrimidine-DNA glycosylase